MRTALDYAALFEDHDAVRVADRREPVRDNKGRAAFHEFVHAVLNDLLGTGIDRGRSLVQDQNRRIGDGRAGDCEQLSLPTVTGSRRRRSALYCSRRANA